MSRYVSNLGDGDPASDLGDATTPTPPPSKEDLLKVAINDPMVAASVKAVAPAPPKPPDKPKVGLPTPPPHLPPPRPSTTNRSPPRPMPPPRRVPSDTGASAAIPSPQPRSRKGLLVVGAIAAGVTALVFLMRRKDDRRRGP